MVLKYYQLDIIRPSVWHSKLFKAKWYMAWCYRSLEWHRGVLQGMHRLRAISICYACYMSFIHTWFILYWAWRAPSRARNRPTRYKHASWRISSWSVAVRYTSAIYQCDNLLSRVDYQPCVIVRFCNAHASYNCVTYARADGAPVQYSRVQYRNIRA